MLIIRAVLLNPCSCLLSDKLSLLILFEIANAAKISRKCTLASPMVSLIAAGFKEHVNVLKVHYYCFGPFFKNWTSEKTVQFASEGTLK